MEDYFLKRYTKKTAKELRSIIANREKYQPDAVNAALKLLDEGHDIPEPTKTASSSTKNYNKSDLGNLNASFDLSLYLKNFHFQDFLTVLTTALSFVTLGEILDYYSDERFIEKSSKLIRWLGLTIFLLGNHAIFRIEHRYSNNYIGRSIHDLLFFTLFFSSRSVYSLFLDSDHSVLSNVEDAFSAVPGLLIIIVLLELLVALLKWIFRLFRWQIL